MSIQWPERPTDIQPFPTGSSFGESLAGGGIGFAGIGAGDSIATMTPPLEQSPPLGGYGGGYGFGGGYGGGEGYSIIQQLMSMIQQLLSQMGISGGNGYGGGGSGYGGGSGWSPYGGEQHFSSATGGSTGDPHLSFNGNTWNDMQSEPDLLHSDSVRGGFQLSTQTTTPNAKGVTYNQQATVTSHNGGLQVSLNNAGQATITQNGTARSIAPGQSLQFGNETVTCNGDGSLQIVNRAENGGEITTTMRDSGQGVDVNVSANNVDLGGSMVNRGEPRMTPD